MTITIEVSDEELKDKIMEIVAERAASGIFDKMGRAKYMFDRDIQRAVKEMLKDNIEEITDRAVLSASRAIEYRGVKKLMDKFTDDVQEELLT